MSTQLIIKNAQANGIVVPAFNIPHLPMLKPIVEAVRDENAAALIQVARLEWKKMKAESLEAVAEEYFKYMDEKHTRLHLDHVPVIDEDYESVDYLAIIKRAMKAGYQSVMVDGSRLALNENIKATREAADCTHEAGIACEAELGAVVGHEKDGMSISYEELFSTRKGFTRIDEAARFAEESHCDWLSVAVGNIHGAIAEKTRNQKKPEARLDVEYVKELRKATKDLPLVLHGGSGVRQEFLLPAIKAGIAKMNIGTEVRQAYEFAMLEKQDIEFGRDAVYQKVRWMLKEYLRLSGAREQIMTV